jgi:hypothetical protein
VSETIGLHVFLVKAMMRSKGKFDRETSRRAFSGSLSLLMLFSSLSVLGSDFGTTGLITIPTARQLGDGQLAATISSNQVVNVFNITYQITPWLESGFRYSVFNPYGRDESRDVLRDRSYEVKARILKETRWRPRVAIGIKDILGTGVWNGEYLVATKSLFGFDVSAGVGWGRFASRKPLKNPLGWIDPRFDWRPAGSVGGEFGGEVRAKSFFRGEVGVFGGVRYQLATLPMAILRQPRIGVVPFFSVFSNR